MNGKLVAIIFVIVAIVGVVAYIMKMRRRSIQESNEEKHVRFADEEGLPLEQTSDDSLPAIDMNELKRTTLNAYNDPEMTQSDHSKPTQGSMFEMPKFEIGGGILNRKGESGPSENQPHFNEFVGVRRGANNDTNAMDVNELDDGEIAAFSRGTRRQIEPIAPRMTLAMRMMDPATVKAMIEASTGKPDEENKQANAVLDKIEKLSKQPKKHKDKKSKKK